MGVPPQPYRSRRLDELFPIVQAGDMHALPFEDDQFDIVILGWVLPYSRNVPKAVEEVARVARNGAVSCVGCNYSLAYRDIQRSVDSPRPHMVDSEAVAIHGPESIEAHFGDWVGEVLFRNRARQPFDAVYIRNMTIFRMFKNPATVAIADTWRDEEALAARVTAQMGPKYTDVENPVHRLLHTFFAAYEKSSRSRTTRLGLSSHETMLLSDERRLDDAVCRMLPGRSPFFCRCSRRHLRVLWACGRMRRLRKRAWNLESVASMSSRAITRRDSSALRSHGGCGDGR